MKTTAREAANVDKTSTPRPSPINIQTEQKCEMTLQSALHLCCRDTRHHCNPHTNATTTAATPYRAYERTADAVLAQRQQGQHGRIANWIERACDCQTPHQRTNKTHPITTNAQKTRALNEEPCSQDTKNAMHRHTPRDQTHVGMHTTGCRAAKY